MKARTIVGALLALTISSIGLTGTAAYAAPARDAAAHCAQDLDSGALACAGSPEEAREELSLQASYAVARLWKDAGYLGQSRTYYKSSPCTSTMNDLEIKVDVVPTGWNDKLSSVETDLSTPNTRCSVRIFRDGHRNGPSFTIDNYTRNLGAFGWNDRASSWYIS